MKPSKRVRGKLLSISVAFFLVFLVFCLITGWPTSMAHLAFLVTISWLISVGLLDPELKTRAIPAMATLCALSLVGGFWVKQALEAEGKKVWVNYDAAFFYLGDENLPAENVFIGFPLPIKGENLLFADFHWALCWQNPLGYIYIQMNGHENKIVNWLEFRGSRTENLSILDWGRENNKLWFKVDKLYPREVFVINASGYVRERELGQVTTKIRGKNPEGSFSSSRPMKIKFWTELTKMVGEHPRLLEAFLSTGEGREGTLELVPTENTFWQLFVRIWA